jgi:hypothetical protein
VDSTSFSVRAYRNAGGERERGCGLERYAHAFEHHRAVRWALIRNVQPAAARCISASLVERGVGGLENEAERYPRGRSAVTLTLMDY